MENKGCRIFFGLFFLILGLIFIILTILGFGRGEIGLALLCVVLGVITGFMAWALLSTSEDDIAHTNKEVLNEIEKAGVLYKYKETIINSANGLMTYQDIERFKKIYTEFSDAYNESYVATLKSVDSLQIQRSAINATKIDPAIAGGLASGLAGPVAGAYVAVNAAERNKEIDSLRIESKFNASMSTSDAEFARKTMLKKYNMVISKMRVHTELLSLYEGMLNNALKEKERKKRKH